MHYSITIWADLTEAFTLFLFFLFFAKFVLLLVEKKTANSISSTAYDTPSAKREVGLIRLNISAVYFYFNSLFLIQLLCSVGCKDVKQIPVPDIPT